MRKGKTAKRARQERALVRLQDDLDSMKKHPELYVFGSIFRKEEELTNLKRNINRLS